MRSLSVVVPAWNEERRLPSSLDAILAYLHLKQLDFLEVLVVDDGSTDGTAGFVRAYATQHPEVRLLQNPGNQGKGYSVRHGMLAARGEWSLLTDADLSAPVEELDRLTSAVTRSGAAVAIGSRALDRSLIGVRQPLLREYVGRVFNRMMRAITGLSFRDTQCGFKLYRADAAREIFSRQRLTGFGFDVEDLVIARVLRVPVVEVPVRWNNAEGTTVGLLSGLKSFLDPLRVRWNEIRGLYHQGGDVRR